MGQFIDRAGKRFGKLLVESFAGLAKYNQTLWNCVCDCGNRTVVAGNHLGNRHTTSCGRCPNDIVLFGDAIVLWLEYKDYRKPCFIDAADYPLVKDYHWYARDGYRGHTLYAHSSGASLRGESDLGHIFMHVLLMGATRVDHKDGDGLNNRRENLRLSTHAENMRNQTRKHSKTGFKGVRPHGSRFSARIQANGKRVFLGLFKTAVEAARAYNEAAKKYHGEFAVLNDVGDHDLVFNQKPDRET